MAQRQSGSGKEEKYFRLFEEAPVAIWDEDFSGVKEFLDTLQQSLAEGELRSHFETNPELVNEVVRRVHVRHVNRVAREFYGAETVGHLIQALPSLFDAEAARVFIDEIASLAEGNTTFSAEFLVSTLKGERRLVQMNVSLLGSGADDWSQVVVVFTDLTERRRLEQSVERANEALRRVNADLEQFAYAAAHDLREPLRTIRLYGQVLERMDLGNLGSGAELAVHFILENASRMDSLISDLLALAAIQPQDLARCPVVDSRSIVEDVLKGVGSAIEHAKANIQVAPLPKVPMQPNHLRQVFQNLIVNGIKYRKPGQRPEIIVSGEELEGEVNFCVADTGLGIAAEDQGRIFEVFSRLHARSVEGTGIGLALCKKIVEQYGGKIWVESTPGVGSNFRFSIPKVEF